MDKTNSSEQMRIALDQFYEATYKFGESTNRADYDAAKRARQWIEDLFALERKHEKG